MRKLVILLAVVFAASLFAAPSVDAAKRTTKRHKMHRTTMRCKKVTKWSCKPVRRAARTRCVRVVPAQPGAGPRVIQPVVNVPQGPAPVVNVPQGPAPVVNVPALPPNTAVTVDSNYIYIVKDNQLMILDKNGLCLKCKVSLDQLSTSTPTGMTTTTSP